MSRITGGCLCGAIRYEYDGEPGPANYCHCADCRRCTGSAFEARLFSVVRGNPSGFTKTGDSGNALLRTDRLAATPRSASTAATSFGQRNRAIGERSMPILAASTAERAQFRTRAASTTASVSARFDGNRQRLPLPDKDHEAFASHQWGELRRAPAGTGG